MYTIILLDAEGWEITRTSEETLTAAKQAARYFLTPVYAKRLGTTPETLAAHKVEVRKGDDCLWDVFI